MDDATREDLDRIVELAKPQLWAGREVHRYLQARGIQLGPARFYSQIPNIEDIETSFEYAPEVDQGPGAFASLGLFDLDEVIRFMDETQVHADEFDPPVTGDRKNPEGYFFDNGAFGYCDAISYWAAIRHFKPDRVVEIGSGFSSLIARDALKANGHGELICIEPFPMPWLKEKLPEARHITSKIQDISADELNDLLGANGLFFIDSTHTVKIGSDCVWIYLELLPKIRHDIHFHVHDVRLPYGINPEHAADRHVHWAEQYILMAYCLGNPRVTFRYGSFMAHRQCPERARRYTNGRIATGGGSVWFHQKGLEC